MSKKRAVYEGCTNLKEIGQRDLENLSSPLTLWGMIETIDRQAGNSNCKAMVIAILGGVSLFAMLMSGVDSSALVMK